MSPATNLAELAPRIRELYRTQDFTYCYAIQAGEGGPIKIGLAKNPADRIKTLQTANAAELRGLAAWRSFPIEERDLHHEFAHAHIRGEWFEPVPDLVDLVLALGGEFEDWT